MNRQLDPAEHTAHHASNVPCIFVILAFVAGCVTTRLTLTPTSPNDLTVPKNISKHFGSMMVLPPRGSERGQVTELSDVERVLLAGGFRVISSGVTGRIVLDPSGNRVETAANLSDLERALVLAKSSNAEALLQIIEIGWTQSRRAFTRAGDEFHEVSIGTSVDGSTLVRVIESVFRIQARVINVDNGEIVMSIDVSQGTSRAVSKAKTIDVQTSPLHGATTSEIETDDPDRRREVIRQVMDSFLARLSRDGRSVAM